MERIKFFRHSLGYKMDFLRGFIIEMWLPLLVILIPVVGYITVAFVVVHFIIKYW